ncbi:HD domain-containing phosphohydrolase [Desulfobacterium sp. N47]
MRSSVRVNLGNLLLSLSDAMELAGPEIAQHQQRTAFIVWQMAKAAGFPKETVEEIFIAALMHDIGALSLEEKESLRLSALRDKGESEVATHCIRGKALLQKVPWLKSSADIVRYHHKYIQEWDEPIDTPIVLKSQMLVLADHLERFIQRDKYILHQEKELVSGINSMKGERFHREVVDYFMAAAGREEFWLDLTSPRLYSILLHEGPYRSPEADIQNLFSFSNVFRNIIDFRSPFTATHSSGVSACAALMATIFGLTETETRLMEIAGDLHDLGKLGVPNRVLEKRGKLDGEEFSIIKSHTYFTYALLNTIGGLEQISEWAAFHHEKLDGSGYPFHCKSTDLDTGARIMAVADLFTAIAEDRPYRKGMSQKEIVKIMKQFSDRKVLDPKIIDLLMAHYDEIDSHVKEVQAKSLEFYKQQFVI